MGRKKRLKGFIDLLSEYLGFNFNIDYFDHRLKLQKYVFITIFFGFNHDYHYDLYVRGPYSTDLADDYYDIYRKGIDSDNSIEMDMDSFSSLIKDKHIDWIESAATMLSLYNSCKSKYNNSNNFDSEGLIKGTNRIKHRISINTIKNVYFDLREYDLFN